MTQPHSENRINDAFWERYHRAGEWENARTRDERQRRQEEKTGDFGLPQNAYVLIIFVGLYGPLCAVNLRRAGYDFRYAYSNEEALAKMRINRPIFLLCYTANHATNGPELVEEVRSNSMLINLPILVIAPEGHFQYIPEMLRLGANECIVVPFRPGEVVDFANRLGAK